MLYILVIILMSHCHMVLIMSWGVNDGCGWNEDEILYSLCGTVGARREDGVLVGLSMRGETKMFHTTATGSGCLVGVGLPKPTRAASEDEPKENKS